MMWAQVLKAIALKGPWPSLKVNELFVRLDALLHEEWMKKMVKCSLNKITHRGKRSVSQTLKQVSRKEG